MGFQNFKIGSLFINIIKGIGPRTEPWGTPEEKESEKPNFTLKTM